MISKWDLSNVEIQTKSVEKALIPLVTQITTLVRQKQKTLISDKAKVALYNIGSVLQRAIRSFVGVGIEMAKENDDLVEDMNEACNEATLAGDSIASLINLNIVNFVDKHPLIEASRSLLASITRVLLLIDVIAVRKLLLTVQKVDMRLKELESVHNFTEFVQCFGHFGADMVELAHVSGDRQDDLKDEKQRAEVSAARALLEKSTMMLLTTCKTCLRHPESPVASGNRNGVFTNMRNAMNLMAVVLETNKVPEKDRCRSLGLHLADFEVIIHAAFADSLHPETAKKLVGCADAITVATQNVLLLKCIATVQKKAIEICCATFASLKDKLKEQVESGEVTLVEVLLEKLSTAASSLSEEILQAVVAEVTRMLAHVNCKKTSQKLRAASLAGSLEDVNKIAAVMKQDIECLKEVSILTCQMGINEPTIITAKKIVDNVESFLAQLIVAAQILSGHPSSKITLENMDVFADVWITQVEELKTILCGIANVERTVSILDGRPSKDLESVIESPPVNNEVIDVKEEVCVTEVSESVSAEMDWDSFQPFTSDKTSVEAEPTDNGDEESSESLSVRLVEGATLSNRLIASKSLSSLLDGVQSEIMEEIQTITKRRDIKGEEVFIWCNCLQNRYVNFVVIDSKCHEQAHHNRVVSVFYKDSNDSQRHFHPGVTLLKNSPFDNNWLHQDVAEVAADVIQTAQFIIDSASKMPLDVTFEHIEMLSSSADEVHRTLQQIISKDLSDDIQQAAIALSNSFSEQLKNVRFSSASFASGHSASLIKLSSVIKQVVVMCTFLYRLMDFLLSSLNKGHLWKVENSLFSDTN